MTPPVGIGARDHGRMGAALAKVRRGAWFAGRGNPERSPARCRVFANAGIPSAVVFVRDENGSHNPKEAMNLDDFVAGIAVMRAGIEEVVK